MDNNEVRLRGTVKRDATAAHSRGAHILDFALSVWSEENSRHDVYDCRMTGESAAYDVLEGFVNEGEELEVLGHLQKTSYTDRQRVAGVMIEVRHTEVVVYVDAIIESEEQE